MMHRVATLELPQAFETALKAYVKQTYFKGTRKADFATRDFTNGDLRFFAKGVAELNRYFTAERAERPRNYFNRKELRSGYLLYFLPVNALKVQALLQNNLPDDFFSQPRRVLDLGSGPGTGAMGTLLAAREILRRDTPRNDSPMVELTLVDHNKSILKDGEQLIARLSDSKPHMIVADLQRPLHSFLPREPYDLIIIANTLNEFPDANKQRQLIRNLMQHYLKSEGYLLIMEPALRLPTRQLMELRDRIAADKMAWIAAPCLHQHACPMLANHPRDWCHMYWEWRRPQLIAAFDKLVGIRKDYLKASYLLLQPVGAGLKPTPTDKNLWRVVSGPLNSKGKTERLLCGEAALPHLLRLSRLDRDRTDANRDFDRAQRGDIITTQAKTRIGKSDRVKKVN